LQGQKDGQLRRLYQDESWLDGQRQRYANALTAFIDRFGDQDVRIFSAAGRSEVSGNHTDHQHGRVLAASVNLDSIAVAAPCQEGIEIVSDGFDISPVDEEDGVRQEEMGRSEALIRGVRANMKKAGFQTGGFKAYVTSSVLAGAGLSSSASFEVLVGTILSGLYNDGKADMVEIAKAGQKAENIYFGKPCGLMDQCACAVGGLITIDFLDPAAPVVKAVDADFSKFNHSLCITDTKGSHADLTDEYAAVPAEMKAVAAYFGKDVLRGITRQTILDNMSSLRQSVSDRAVLRALHFIEEDARVPEIVDALAAGDFSAFLKGIEASGNSSFKYLQNVYASSDPAHQGVSLALAVSEGLLKGHGVSRVHGGGFAGTIQAFVEDDFVETYREGMDAVFGDGSCHVLHVRPDGGTELE
jgi:galactokinase